MNDVQFGQSYNNLNTGNSSSKIKLKNGNSLGGFHLRRISGDIFLWGDYRFQSNQLNTGFKEEQKSGAFSGEINLSTLSYLIHPNFLLLDFELGYAPGTQSNNFLVAPDRTDTRTAEKVNLALTFFDQRPVSLKGFANYNHSFINRELTSDVESYQLTTGAILYPQNDMLPASISYKYDKWQQNELQSQRDFESQTHNITVQLKKKFTEINDDHEIIASYNDYYRKYSSNSAVYNQVSRISLRDHFYFNSDRRNNYRSQIWWQNQEGSQPYKKFQVDQNLFVMPFYKFGIDARYQYYKYNTPGIKSRKHYVFGELSHKLYESLKTFANIEYDDGKQTFFNENIQRASVGFNYQKKIPSGSFHLNYAWNNQKNDRVSIPANLVVVNEEHILSDGDIVLLENPAIISSTVVVTDETESIIYDENLDYLLFERGEFTEIRRIPGGQIPDGGIVWVDYESSFQANYTYTASGNRFQIGANLLWNLLDVYFAYNDFDYSSFEGMGFGTLKFFNQRLLGAKTNISIFTAGFEYDDYNSNITPYRSLRYYINLSDVIFNKLLFAVNISYRDYLLTADNDTQIYKDGTGRLSYMFTPQIKLNFLAFTRFQNGREIDLDLYSLRTEFETRIREIVLIFGYENFYRDFSGEKVNYNNIYLRIGRYF